MSKTQVMLAVILATGLLQPASANIPILSASVDGYTAIGVGVIPSSDHVPITVTRNDGPLHAEANGSGGNTIIDSLPISGSVPSYTNASAGGFASAGPGVLHVYGFQNAIARNGAINDTSENGIPVANNRTVATQISVSAGFTDYLTVGYKDLAVGTPVQVPFNFLVEVISDTVLGYPQFSTHPISVFASFNIPGLSPQIFSSEAGLNFFQSTPLPNGNYLSVIRSIPDILISALVGDVLTISASFGVYGGANITHLNGEFESHGLVDGRNTAAIWLGDLPNGMIITSASGHDYTIDPTVAVPAVPIPSAIWLFGFALAGMIKFSRNKRC